MNFYEFKAKCGHVGRTQYYEGVFYIRAENGREAASIVRFRPRVKHNHKDAILSVTKIEHIDFKKGQAAEKSNPYFNCYSRREQDKIIDLILGDIHIENRVYYNEKRDDADRQSKLEALRRQFRKMNKYSQYKLGA